MAKQKTASEIDEDYIRAVMSADVPQIRMRKQIAAEQKAARENLDPWATQLTGALRTDDKPSAIELARIAEVRRRKAKSTRKYLCLYRMRYAREG